MKRRKIAIQILPDPVEGQILWEALQGSLGEAPWLTVTIDVASAEDLTVLCHSPLDLAISLTDSAGDVAEEVEEDGRETMRDGWVRERKRQKDALWEKTRPEVQDESATGLWADPGGLGEAWPMGACVWPPTQGAAVDTALADSSRLGEWYPPRPDNSQERGGPPQPGRWWWWRKKNHDTGGWL
jgi:hypothetical protein